MQKTKHAVSAEQRNQKVLAVLKAATGPLAPTQIAAKIAEPWCCYDGNPSYAHSAAISPICKRIGAVKVSHGLWVAPRPAD